MKQTISIIIVFFCFCLLAIRAKEPRMGKAQELLTEQKPLNGHALRVGETLVYSVSLKRIPAGKQVMKVIGRSERSGQEVYTVKSETKDNRFFSLFYAFHDKRESVIMRAGFQPLSYKQDIQDGKRKAKIFIEFDQKSQKAKITENEKQKELTILPKTQDELSMLYLIRVKKLKVGQNYTFPALIGAKKKEVKVAVVKRELLKTVLGKKTTLVVKTASETEVTLWLTDDKNRIPVKMVASTRLGKLTATLKLRS